MHVVMISDVLTSLNLCKSDGVFRVQSGPCFQQLGQNSYFGQHSTDVSSGYIIMEYY